MDDDKLQLLQQISDLEEKNQFLRNTVKAKYPDPSFNHNDLEDKENVSYNSI